MISFFRRLVSAFLSLRSNVQAVVAKKLVERRVVNVLKLSHAQELANVPRNEWPMVRSKQIEEIRAVRDGQFDIVDRRSWAFPYLPEALHRLNQPILKNTPYNLRRFSETPIPRRAINLVKNSVLSLKWKIQPSTDEDDVDSERELRINIATETLKRPNNIDSFRELMEAAIEDLLLGGYMTLEPRMTPFYKRPFKVWAVDGSTIRLFMDWTESTPDRPRFAQMTGLKGERGIVTFLDNELIYIRDNVRTSTPFGMGKMEVAFNSINSFLGVQDMAGRSGSDQIHKCFPGDTEVLTRRGWIAWREVKDNEEFATRSPEGSLQWQRALGFVREQHDGDMIRFNNRGLTITVTPNHRMYGRRFTKDWRTTKRVAEPTGFVEAVELFDAVKNRPGKAWKGNRKSDLTLYDFRIPTRTQWEEGKLPDTVARVGSKTFAWEDWAAFLGIWIAEGSCLVRLSRSEHRVQVAQSKSANPRKYAKIKRLLDRMGFNYKAKVDRFLFNDRDVCEYLSAQCGSHNKFVPQVIKDAPTHIVKTFFDWAMLGDGHTRKSGKRTYYTVSKRLAGDMQELFQKIGSSAAVIGYLDKGHQIYRVEEMLNAEISIIPEGGRGKVRTPRRVPFSGMVYCAMVPNGTLYCRENGYAFWSGNTWLWWENTMNPAHLQTVRRHITNELEGQSKISLMAGVKQPKVVEVTPVTPEDLLLDWQRFLIDIIAAAFDLSPMALGQTERVNKAVGQVLADSDFRSAVVPTAKRIEEGITRHLLHGFIGWKDLEFKFIGLDDPDALTATIIQQRDYMTNAITPDEIREVKNRPALPGGWGKLTYSQMQIMMMAEMAKMTGKASTSGGGGMGGGMSSGMGSGMGMGSSGMGGSMGSGSISAAQVASMMSPQDVDLFREFGIMPPNLAMQIEQQQPGVLETMTDELQQFFEHLEQVEEMDEIPEAPITPADEQMQLERFTESEHQESLAEKSINRRGVFGPAINQQIRKSPERGKYPRSGGRSATPEGTVPEAEMGKAQQKIKKNYRPGKNNPYQ